MKHYEDLEMMLGVLFVKIAYVLTHKFSKSDGVTRKIIQQVSTWRNLGHEAEVFCLVKEKTDTGFRINQYVMHGNALLGRLRRSDQMIADMRAYKPDIVYVRYDLWSATLGAILQSFKTVVEINTDDVLEYLLLLRSQRSISSLSKVALNMVTRGRILRNARGLVCVTHELAERKRFSKFFQSVAVVPNSINLDEFKTIKTTDNDSGNVNLCFIGSPGFSWHGLDILENLAALLKDCTFHVIGEQKANSMNNVIYYGYLNKGESEEIIKNCHFGIGTLALFRRGLKEACPIKVREYIAYGLPIIIGYDDTAFARTGNPEWVFQVVISDNKVVNVEELRGFIAKYKSYLVSDVDKKKYVDIVQAEKARTNFFAGIS